MSRILIVDDERSARLTLSRVLSQRGFRCETADDAEQAQLQLAAAEYELVLLDINLPGESGLDLVRRISREYPDTAVVMATAFDDATLADVAIENGAYGYIIKPFRVSEVLINVSNALRRRSLEIENHDYQQNIERMLTIRTTELRETIAQLRISQSRERQFSEATIQRLMKAAEFRDSETAEHIQRMSRYSGCIARAIGYTDIEADRLRIAASMHDVGKLCTPDRILLKPGKLTPDEIAVMRLHTEHGYRILAGTGADLLDLAADIAFTHHERFDGGGYPKGLVGNKIPIEGRIAAAADVFDALTSARCYKPAFGVQRSIEMMESGAGGQLDLEMVSIIRKNLDEILLIRTEYPDSVAA